MTVDAACPLCGSPTAAGAPRCPSCGYALAGVDGRPGPFTSAGVRWWIGTVLVIYAIAVIVVLVAGD